MYLISLSADWMTLWGSGLRRRVYQRYRRSNIFPHYSWINNHHPSGWNTRSFWNLDTVLSLTLLVSSLIFLTILSLQNMPESLADTVGGKIFTFGSYRLGALNMPIKSLEINIGKVSTLPFFNTWEAWEGKVSVGQYDEQYWKRCCREM